MYYQKNSVSYVLLAICCYIGVVASYKIVSTDNVNAKHNINYYEYNSDNNGNYNFSFKSPDIEREESGQVIDVGQPGQYIRVTGKYSYIEDTGEGRRQLKIFYYTADKDGYRIDENRSASSDEPPELVSYVLLAIYCYIGVVASYKIVSTDNVNAKHNINYYEYNSDNNGNYNFSFKSPDIEREETGQVIDVGQPGQYIRVTGKYSYIEDTGEGRRQLKIFYYTADKDGYRIDENRSASSDEPPELGFRDKDHNLDLIRTLIG